MNRLIALSQARQWALMLSILTLVGCASANMSVSVDVYKEDARQNTPLFDSEALRFRQFVAQSDAKMSDTHFFYQNLATQTEKMQVSLEAAFFARNDDRPYLHHAETPVWKSYVKLRKNLSSNTRSAQKLVTELKAALDQRAPRSTVYQLLLRVRQAQESLGEDLSAIYRRSVGGLVDKMRNDAVPLVRSFDERQQTVLSDLKTAKQNLVQAERAANAKLETTRNEFEAIGQENARLLTERAEIQTQIESLRISIDELTQQESVQKSKLQELDQQEETPQLVENRQRIEAELLLIQNQILETNEGLADPQKRLTANLNSGDANITRQKELQASMVETGTEVRQITNKINENQRKMERMIEVYTKRRPRIVMRLKNVIAYYNEILNLLDGAASKSNADELITARQHIRAARLNANEVFNIAKEVGAQVGTETAATGTSNDDPGNRVDSLIALISENQGAVRAFETSLANLAGPTSNALLNQFGRVGRSVVAIDKSANHETAKDIAFYNSQIDRLQNPADPVLREITDPKNEQKWHPLVSETKFEAQGNSSVVVVRDRPGAYNIKKAANNPAALIKGQLRITRAVASGLQDALNAVAGVTGFPVPNLSIGQEKQGGEQLPLVGQNIEARETAIDAQIEALRNTRRGLNVALSNLENVIALEQAGTLSEELSGRLHANLTARRVLFGDALPPIPAKTLTLPAPEGDESTATLGDVGPIPPAVSTAVGEVVTTPVEDLTQ